MGKRTLAILGAALLILGGVTGCQDAATTAPTTGSSSYTESDFTVYVPAKPIVIGDETEIPSVAEVTSDAQLGMNPPNDRGHGPSDRHFNDGRGHDGNGGEGHPPVDRLNLQPMRYLQILHGLRLTDTQWTAVRQCLSDYQLCVHSDLDSARVRHGELHQALVDSLRSVHAALQDSTITLEQARQRYERLVGAYRDAVDTLRTRLDNALSDCRDAFISCVESNLTAEQIAAWRDALRRMHDGGPGRGNG